MIYLQALPSRATEYRVRGAKRRFELLFHPLISYVRLLFGSPPGCFFEAPTLCNALKGSVGGGLKTQSMRSKCKFELWSCFGPTIQLLDVPRSSDRHLLAPAVCFWSLERFEAVSEGVGGEGVLRLFIASTSKSNLWCACRLTKNFCLPNSDSGSKV